MEYLNHNYIYIFGGIMKKNIKKILTLALSSILIIHKVVVQTVRKAQIIMQL